MDEFLLERAKELEQIRDNLDRLEEVLRQLVPESSAGMKELEFVRRDVEDRLRKAEAAYAAF